MPSALVLERNYGNEGFVVFLAGEFDGTVNKCIEGVVLTDTYIEVGVVNCTSLAYDDVAGLYYLTAELLDAKSFAM